MPRLLPRGTAPGEEASPIFRTAIGWDSTTCDRNDGEIARGGILKGRDVAIRVPREDFRDNVDLVRRPAEGAQIGDQLPHPGIGPIDELGTSADRPGRRRRPVEPRAPGPGRRRH